jgi:hypothetical protein
MSDDDTRRQTSEDDDEAKVARLIAEGVFTEDLAEDEDYEAVVAGLTPDEVEVISSINKRFKLVKKLKPDDPGIESFGKF